MVESDCALKETPQTARFYRRVPGICWAVLGGLTALYCVLVRLEIGRHLWFDELLTYHIAQAPTLGRLFCLVKRWDLNPPLLHVLAHAALRLSGGSLTAIRIPSAIEFYFAGVLLFFYGIRKLGLAFAALPVLLFWYSPMFRYATEARPYALLCFWFCALLLLWDIAVSKRRSRLVLTGVAVASLGLVSSHVLAPLSLLGFFAAEIWRYVKRRKPDYPLWTALFLPILLTFLYLPFYASFRTITDYPFAFQASPGKLASFYWHTFEDVFWCWSAATLAAFLAAKHRWAWRLPAWWRGQWPLFAILAAVPVLVDLMMMLDQAPFWGRYCMSSVVVLYFLCALAVATGFQRIPRAGYAAIGAAFALVSIQRVIVPWHHMLVQPVPWNAAALEDVKPDLPIVAASGLTFVEMGQYESPALVSRLFYLEDRRAAIQFAHATIFEDISDFQQAFKLPGTIESYRQFTQAHPDFLVFGTYDYPEDWLLRKLRADGAAITPLRKYAMPYKDKTLFEVRVKDKAEARADSRRDQGEASKASRMRGWLR